MPDGDTLPETLRPAAPGAQLRAAREAQELSMEEIATRTRIPQRHLEAIERSDYAALPSTTYAMGFSRAYARAVGADEVAIASAVRGELSTLAERRISIPVYEIDDPARSPSRGLVFVAAGLAVLILIAVGIYYGTGLFRTADAPAPTNVAVPVEKAGAPTPAAAPVSGGQVTLTATDEVWVRIYDAKDQTLLMKTMAAGERYDVPPGADNPQINIGRPDKLTVTVNGSSVPPLGDGRVAIKDVSVSADALLARAAPATGIGNTTAP
jgi:cytoskeleton protein RodZ